MVVGRHGEHGTLVVESNVLERFVFVTVTIQLLVTMENIAQDLMMRNVEVKGHTVA